MNTDLEQTTFNGKRGYCRAKLASLCRRFAVFLLSTGGLSIALVAYSILGGIMFKYLEGPAESRTRIKMNLTVEWHAKQMFEATENLSVTISDPDRWREMAKSFLENVTQVVFTATKYDGWDGVSEGRELQWSFAGSLLYSITVITTIGYGHVVPKTDEGKLVTMAYAVVGIPLTMLTLINLGSFMAVLLRFMYKLTCGILCARCQRCSKVEPPRDDVIAIENDATAHVVPQSSDAYRVSRDSCAVNRDEETDGIGEGVDRELDVGGGKDEGNEDIYHDGTARTPNRPPEVKSFRKTGRETEPEQQKLSVCEATDAVEEMPKSGEMIDPQYNGRETEVGASVKQSATSDPKSGRNRLTAVRRRLLKWRRGLQIHLHSDDSRRVRVPVYVGLLVMAVYVASGSLLFTLWENWNFLDGFYFCFVTLSTIGFGDYVPGTSAADWASQQKLILCSLYLVFGLALIVMCFNLMQETVREKCHRVARKIGLVAGGGDRH